MAFVKDFVGKHKKSASNVTMEENSEEAQETEELMTENDDITDSASIAEALEDTASLSTSSQVAPTRTAPKRKIVGVEAVAQPMIEFFKSRTVQNPAMNQPIPSLGPTAKFMDSLVPDVEKLNPRRQRMFKARVLETLNNLLDEQEAETERYQASYSRPISSLSTSSYQHQPTSLETSLDNTDSPSQLVNYVNTFNVLNS